MPAYEKPPALPGDIYFVLTDGFGQSFGQSAGGSAHFPDLFRGDAVLMEAAGADAVGINCSVGPDQLVSVVRNIRDNVSIPVIAKPNAGMPVIDDSGNAVYSMHAEDFARHMKVLIESGASVVGGCCGTTPAFIKALHDIIR